MTTLTSPPASGTDPGTGPTTDAGTDPTTDAGTGAAVADAEQALSVPLAELRPALEALLMVADQPLGPVTLAAAVGHPQHEVAEALTRLAGEYDAQGRGFELREVAGGWRFYTREALAPVVERFVRDGQQARLTQAALETLAVVAYRQPVSRARVSAIRGVNVDGVMRTLVARGLVEEAGQDAESHALLYRTTAYFLERIGVSSLDDLPELAPLLPDGSDLADLDPPESLPGSVPDGRSADGSDDGSDDGSGSAPGSAPGAGPRLGEEPDHP